MSPDAKPMTETGRSGPECPSRTHAGASPSNRLVHTLLGALVQVDFGKRASPFCDSVFARCRARIGLSGFSYAGPHIRAAGASIGSMTRLCPRWRPLVVMPVVHGRIDPSKTRRGSNRSRLLGKALKLRNLLVSKPSCDRSDGRQCGRA